MRSLKGLVLAVVASTLVAASTASAGPTTVTSVYTVGGLTVPGVTTGLVLAPRMSVTVTATGGVCPYGTTYCPGPDGNPAVDTTGTVFGGFPAPGAPAWGLVARVGSGPWTHVGSGPTRVSGTGVLQLAVNDDLLVDNRGSFTVTVSYTCWPGWGYGDKNHTHCGPPGLADNPSARSGNGSAEDRGNRGQGSGSDNGQGKALGHSKR